MDTSKRADQVALGEFVAINANESARVTRICRNPHHGWIGFELNDSNRFFGWFKPNQEVVAFMPHHTPRCPICAGLNCKNPHDGRY